MLNELVLSHCLTARVTGPMLYDGLEGNKYDVPKEASKVIA